ncbi:MAG TPA: hypothetical protein DEA08_35705 [Planctomycetes bacterium]|nr:hypothetical protein [Planctomycetota bacterium]
MFRCELAFGDGPGVRLHLRDSHRGTSGPTWRLPALFNTDTNRYREVLCVFNLDAKTATVLVDGIRLETFSKKGVPRKAFFGLEFLGRTQGKVRNLRLIQFRPRELR